MSFWKSEKHDGEQWAPVADLMAALMLIFMFIAIVYIRTVVIAEEVNAEECDKIYQVLKTQFDDDFEKWDVELLTDLTVRFRNPRILFESEQSEILEGFKIILKNFFPRYMDVIQSEEFRDDIREIRIEGHTSSVYESCEIDPYLCNMNLSQRRALAILNYVLTLDNASGYSEWAKQRITANGLSSSKPIRIKGAEIEDKARSRRVEFRLLTASCQKAGRYDREVATNEN